MDPVFLIYKEAEHHGVTGHSPPGREEGERGEDTGKSEQGTISISLENQGGN